MRATTAATTPVAYLRWAVPVASAAGVLVTAAAVTGHEDAVTTYAGASALGAAGTLAAGLALVGAGLAAWTRPPTASAGTLAASAGLAWLAPVWVGWPDHALVRSVAMVATPFLLPLLIHLLLSRGTGWLHTRADRVGAAAVYGVTGAYSLGRALVRDPLLDRHCWSNCTDNVFLAEPLPGVARVLDTCWQAFALVAGGLAVAVAVTRLLRATAVGRAETWPLVASLALAVAAESGYAALLLLEPAENPLDTTFEVVFVARAAALTATAIALGATVLRGRRRRRVIARLASDLGTTPPLGSLQTTLARSLGDETLTVAYWLAGPGRYVDAAGRPAELVATGERATTSILRDGVPVAAIGHDRALYRDQQLAEQIGAAARLAIDNERLQAEVLAHLEELRASRARIVTAADEARRRIERDLHDGAQQTMIALVFELRLAHADAVANDDAQLAALLDAATAEATLAIEELRRLAHGIFPAILDEAGLRPALSTLADRSAVPVELSGIPDRPLGTADRTAYLVVSGAVEAAERAAGGTVRVRMDHHDGRVLIHVDGVPAGRYIHLADRVGSIGGELTCTNGSLRAEIPCA